MIKVIFVLAITVAFESAYLMASISNWVGAMWALASILWVLLANYLYDNGIGKKRINKYIKRNGLGNIKYGMGWQKPKGKQGMAFIMRGVPGSGKSTIAETFAKAGAVIHSTDNYFIGKDGVYKFDRDNLGHYHYLNYTAFCESIDKGEAIVVVDNTNYKPSLYREYLEYAKENGYLVCAYTFKPADIELHIKRCIHNVPLKTLEHMHKVMLDNLDTIGADYNFIVEVK